MHLESKYLAQMRLMLSYSTLSTASMHRGGGGLPTEAAVANYAAQHKVVYSGGLTLTTDWQTIDVDAVDVNSTLLVYATIDSATGDSYPVVGIVLNPLSTDSNNVLLMCRSLASIYDNLIFGSIGLVEVSGTILSLRNATRERYLRINTSQSTISVGTLSSSITVTKIVAIT